MKYKMETFMAYPDKKYHIGRKCAIIFLFLTIFLNINGYSRGKEIIDAGILKIDSCLYINNDSIVRDPHIGVFAGLMQDLFKADFVDYDTQTTHVLLKRKVYEEFKAYLQENYTSATKKIDREIRKNFSFHSIHRVEKDYPMIYLIHYLDPSIDNHVFDCARICDYYLKKLASNKKENSKYGLTDETRSFVYVAERAVNSYFYFHDHGYLTNTITEEQFFALTRWCEQLKEREDCDKVFLDAYTNYQIERWFWAFILDSY